MIDNSALSSILATATDLTTVVEIYDSDYVPDPISGFDSDAAIGLYASIAGLAPDYTGRTYTRAVSSIDNIKKTLTDESNAASVTFSNVDRQISTFESENGFDGLIMCIRLISRGSSDTVGKTLVLFGGRCDKPQSGTKDSLTVTARSVYDFPNTSIPRRKYTKEDADGRVSSDPEFEGFENIPQQGVSSYQVREKRGGLAGLLGLKHWVTKTLSWSSFSDLDATKSVPEVFGTTQILGTHIAFADEGTTIAIRTAFCEGEIAEFTGFRSLDPLFPLDGPPLFAFVLGQTGAANYDSGGIAPANYSRTVVFRCQSSFSTTDENDTAPDIIATIKGRLLTLPNGSGSWVTTGVWSENAAAIGRFLLTDEHYGNLDAGWLDDAAAYECYLHNEAFVISRNTSDLVWLKEG